MTLKMIASDMDGTFLDEKGSYDRERFLKILDQLDERGIEFVVASGNNMERLSLIFKGLTDRMSFVAENGAHVVVEGKTVKRHKIHTSDVQLFLDYFKDDLGTFAVIISGQYNSYMQKNAVLPKMMAIEPEQIEQFFSKIKQIEDLQSIISEDILKISMMVPLDQCDDIIEKFNKEFKGDLTAVTSGFGSVDIIQTGIHKAWGLSLLMDKYQVVPEQLMTFGDGGNDIEMLQLASYSYAMDNAPQVVKQAAKHVAPSHKHNGVLEMIEKYLNENN